MIKSICDRAVSKYKTEGYAFDPAMILVIAEVIMELIVVLQDNCDQTPEEAESIVTNPSFLQKRIVRNSVVKTMGRREYRRSNGAAVVQAILDAGKETTLEEVKEAYLLVKF